MQHSKVNSFCSYCTEGVIPVENSKENLIIYFKNFRTVNFPTLSSSPMCYGIKCFDGSLTPSFTNNTLNLKPCLLYTTQHFIYTS
jgi:hypothetical protein